MLRKETVTLHMECPQFSQRDAVSYVTGWVRCGKEKTLWHAFNYTLQKVGLSN